MANKIIHKHSSVITDGQAKLPESHQLEFGELAVNYAAGVETISLKNTSGQIVEFKSTKQIEDIIDKSANAIKEELNDYATKEELLTTDARVNKNEIVTAGALTNLDERIIDLNDCTNDLDDRIDNLSEVTDSLDSRITILENAEVEIDLSAYATKEEFETLETTFIDNEFITAAALTELNKRVGTVELTISNLNEQTSVSYAELVELRNNNNLIPGMWYRITDYNTIAVNTEDNEHEIQYVSAGHQFDVIVLATSTNTLSEETKAIQHEDDEYFNDSNLEAWKLWYCLDNDTNRFTWADSENGKGVIYRMIDEHDNDCPYDFKNIQFKRKLTDGVLDTENGVDTWCYTFNAYCIDNTNIYDASVIARKEMIDDDANRCHGNIIKEYYGYINNEGSYLNDIVFLNIYGIEDSWYFYCSSNSFGNNCRSNSFGDSCNDNSFGNSCYNNSFGNYCRSNSFGNSCNNNSFGNDSWNNSFGYNCYSNIFGYECSSNSFGNDCYNNSFGNYCQSNTFRNDCRSNTFINDCYFNSFGNNCYNNSFEEECSSNSFEEKCSSNSFGNICSSNSFGNDCRSNSFGDDCYGNTFGGDCSSNSFGDNYYHNSFGNRCSYNSFRNSASETGTLKNYCMYNHFDDGCSYNIIWNSNTTSTSISLKNVNVNRGVSGTMSSYNRINIDVLNQDYEIQVAKNSNGEIKIYCEADLIA